MIVDAKFELFVGDVAESVRFYSALGFAPTETKVDGYTTMVSGSTVIALSPVPTWLPLRWFGFLRRPPLGTEIVLYTRALRAARRQLEDAGYAPGEILLRPWGVEDFRITDYEGYYLRISALPEADAAR